MNITVASGQRRFESADLEISAALAKLDDLGPGGPLNEIEAIIQRLPPGHEMRQFAAGYVAGRRGGKCSCEADDFIKGWWAGRCGDWRD
jgi:hypothetical protein